MYSGKVLAEMDGQCSGCNNLIYRRYMPSVRHGNIVKMKMITEKKIRMAQIVIVRVSG